MPEAGVDLPDDDFVATAVAAERAALAATAATAARASNDLSAHDGLSGDSLSLTEIAAMGSAGND